MNRTRAGLGPTAPQACDVRAGMITDWPGRAARWSISRRGGFAIPIAWNQQNQVPGDCGTRRSRKPSFIRQSTVFSSALRRRPNQYIVARNSNHFEVPTRLAGPQAPTTAAILKQVSSLSRALSMTKHLRPRRLGT
jgi:hypothetical protein